MGKNDKSNAEQSSAPQEEDTQQTAQTSVNPDDLDSWPLQADRVSIRSSLVESLRITAGHFGRRVSSASLTAGLPIPKSGITPSLFVRAAKRADLHAALAERTLESLAIAPNLPCILVLEHGQSCILWDVKYPKGAAPKKGAKGVMEIHPETRFVVQFPETPDDKKVVKLENLAKIYTSYAFFVRPIARSDDRAGPAEIEEGRDWFWSALKENARTYKEVILAAVMINAFALTSSIYIMNVYDKVLPNKSESAYDTLLMLTVGAAVVFIFEFVLKNLRALLLDHSGRKADVKISARLFEHILGMKLAARPASAGVLASNMKEFETLRDFFTSATMATLIDLPFTVFFVLIIAYIGGWLAIVPAVAIPLVIIVGFILQKPLQKVIRESMNESALKNALLFETITGLETIKVQAAEGHTQRNWEELTDKSSRTSVKAKKLSTFAQNMAILIQQFASIGIVVLGVYLIHNSDTMQMGTLIACVILNGRALAPLAQVAGLMTRLQQSRESLAQLNDLMKKPVERPAGKHHISLPHVSGQVDFKEVVFRYPGQNRPALNGVTFTIEPGEHIGIIGAVGSGKTTIERLLLNLYEPESGTVQLDGTDVRQIDPGDLRRNVGGVQQSPQLFYGSVRDNITMGHETAPDEAVLRAAELAGVMEFLKDSEHGLDTQVGERGEALSGGQRQSVAIARSLLYDPPVLILDEPTASMDPASENRLRLRLHKITEGKTTILITHKGAMLSLVDKLILIDRGRIVAFGPKDEVISKLQARQYGSSAENDKV